MYFFSLFLDSLLNSFCALYFDRMQWLMITNLWYFEILWELNSNKPNSFFFKSLLYTILITNVLCNFLSFCTWCKNKPSLNQEYFRPAVGLFRVELFRDDFPLCRKPFLWNKSNTIQSTLFFLRIQTVLNKNCQHTVLIQHGVAYKTRIDLSRRRLKDIFLWFFNWREERRGK